MRGVFIVVGVGIVGGLALIVIEIAYKTHQIRRSKRNEVTRMAFMKWRGNVEVREEEKGGREKTVIKFKETKLIFSMNCILLHFLHAVYCKRRFFDHLQSPNPGSSYVSKLHDPKTDYDSGPALFQKSRLRSTFLGGGENYVNPHGNGLGNLRSLSDGDFKGTARDITPDSMTTLSVDTLRENSNCKMRISSGWRDDQGFNTTLVQNRFF